MFWPVYGVTAQVLTGVREVVGQEAWKETKGGGSRVQMVQAIQKGVPRTGLRRYPDVGGPV